MATRDEVARQPLEQRRARLTRTADDLTAAIHGQAEAVLARRGELQAQLDDRRARARELLARAAAAPPLTLDSGREP